MLVFGERLFYGKRLFCGVQHKLDYTSIFVLIYVPLTYFRKCDFYFADLNIFYMHVYYTMMK